MDRTRLRLWIVLLSAPLVAGRGLAQLTLAGNERLYQSEVGGLVEAGDAFGAALAAGDFNGDGWDDLAVGTPGEGVGAISGAGGVVVAFGSAAGLASGNPAGQGLHQDVVNVDDVAETSDGFGSALAAGDFNGDGYTDLAVGVPYENLDGVSNAGAVHLFLGGSSGLSPAVANPFVSGLSLGPGVYGVELEARFGASLVACDRNGDGRDDLVVGVPSPGAGLRPGALVELFGTASGVTTAGAVYRQAGEPAVDDEFAGALACGRLDGVAGEDLLVGAPEALDADGIDRVGAVWRITGAGGVTLVRRGPSKGDRSGSAVVVGFLFQTSLEGALWTAPHADVFVAPDTFLNAGEASTTSFFIDQRSSSTGDAPEMNDLFGEALVAGDFDRDGDDEAVFGTPREDLPAAGPGGTIWDAGIVQVLAGPLGTGPAQPYSAEFAWGSGAQFGFAGLPDDKFGAALAVGDFDKDGIDDLAIGAPGAEWNSADGTGIVQIVYGSKPNWIFGDGFESGKPWKWSDSAP